MRLSIRNQLLLPLLALMLGVVGMSTWTAWSSAQRARRQIEEQMEAIAATVNKVPLPLNPQTLPLMKGLTEVYNIFRDNTDGLLLGKMNADEFTKKLDEELKKALQQAYG